MLRHLGRAGNRLRALAAPTQSYMRPASTAIGALRHGECSYSHQSSSQVEHATVALKQLSISYLVQNPGVQVTPSLNQTEYKLPSVISNSVCKKTILDPLVTPRSYELPTYQTVLLEKVSPAVGNESPKIDPLPLAIRKEAAWIVRIRHKKMKKHKLKKLHKRMFFWNKKQADIKKKKKEKMMLLVEKEFATWAAEFDAEKHVEEQIGMAKKGGWGINIFETRKQEHRSS